MYQSLQKSSAVECVWLTEKPEYWESEFRWCKENKEEIRNQFEHQKSRLEEQLLQRQTDEKKDSSREIIQQFNARDRREINACSVALDFLFSDFDLKTYISKRHKEEMNTVLRLEGPLPVRSIYNETNSFIERSRTLLYARTDDIKVFHIAELVIEAGKALGQTLRVLYPIRPFRSLPQRYYIPTGATPWHVGYWGHLLPDLLFRRPELVKQTNEWLKRLDIDYELAVNSIGTDPGGSFCGEAYRYPSKRTCECSTARCGFRD